MMEEMKARRNNWETTWREVSLYVLPNKDDVYTWKNKSRGEEKHERLYDSSAIHFNELLAAALHSIITNPTSQWFGLKTGKEALDRKPKVKSWLQKLVREIHNILNNTNFQSEVHELYLDLGCFGTGVLRIDEDEENIFHFLSRPIYETYIRESYKKIVNIVATEDIMSNRQAFEKYGMESFGDKAKDMGKKLDDEIEIIHIVMPLSEVEIRGLPMMGKEWVSIHVWKKGETVLRMKGFNEFPYVVPRWLKTTGEVYGRSPAFKALPDIRMLNAMKKTVIRGAQKMVDPPLLVPDDGVMGRVNTTPGGLNSYRSGTKDRIEPLLTGGRPDIGLDLIREVKQSVKEDFFVDQLQIREGDRMTTVEVSIRDEDRIRILSPMSGRLHFEFLQPLVARMLGIMSRRNLLPPDMPAELRGIAPQVRFASQVEKALRAAEGNNINRFMGTVGPILQVFPESRDILNGDGAIRFMGDILDVPQEVFKSEEEVEETRAAREQQMQKMQQQQDNLATAEVAQKTAGVLPLKSGE